jgi:hypothetical protein
MPSPVPRIAGNPATILPEPRVAGRGMALFVLPWTAATWAGSHGDITMKVQPVITFRNLSPVDWIEADIQDRVRRLQSSCAGITTCRVLVEIPHRHHKHGNRFHLRIDLSVPGGDIAVSHAPDLHTAQRDLEDATPEKRMEIEAGHKDGRLVIRQAFDKARRRLRDRARRRQPGAKAQTRRGRDRAGRRAVRAAI